MRLDYGHPTQPKSLNLALGPAQTVGLEAARVWYTTCLQTGPLPAQTIASANQSADTRTRSEQIMLTFGLLQKLSAANLATFKTVNNNAY